MCPVFSSSLEASFSASNCTCDAGYVGGNGQPCTICEAGKFKTGRGDGTCQDCPAHSSSPEGSEVVEECTCDAGAFGSNGVECQLCQLGKYKPEIGADACLQCRSNSYSPAGSNTSDACTCNSGYQGTGKTECYNLNECLEVTTNDCASGKAACTDTDGSFNCECIAPFFGNGTFCEARFAAIAMSIRVSIGAQAFETYRNTLIQALADLCNVDPSSVELVLVQAGLLQRRLLSTVQSTAAATNIDLVMHVQSLSLNNILALLSPANLNATLVRLGFPQITVLVSAFVTSECGDGFIEASEICDDGNTLNGDGCSVQCSIETGWNALRRLP